MNPSGVDLGQVIVLTSPPQVPESHQLVLPAHFRPLAHCPTGAVGSQRQPAESGGLSQDAMVDAMRAEDRNRRQTAGMFMVP